ncbi:Stackhouse genomic scaffold, scaffold 388 [Trichuris trichiura]|uniref:Stackhouse genomic scaffold, scaffold 388 n=1 Tax=Trichuris trichiura TaxID=36087 RepID=A0A077YZY0_TRITR|nr:Stackhouse genomic scaffold, scaffold 388 [Trichuris trichiura]
MLIQSPLFRYEASNCSALGADSVRPSRLSTVIKACQSSRYRIEHPIVRSPGFTVDAHYFGSTSAGYWAEKVIVFDRHPRKDGDTVALSSGKNG